MLHSTGQLLPWIQWLANHIYLVSLVSARLSYQIDLFKNLNWLVVKMDKSFELTAKKYINFIAHMHRIWVECVKGKFYQFYIYFATCKVERFKLLSISTHFVTVALWQNVYLFKGDGRFENDASKQ